MPRRQRLRRGVGHAAPVPRGAARLDLGGLGQRHGARRPARAARDPGALDVFLAEVDEAAGRRRAPRRVRRRACAPSSPTPTSSSTARAASSSGMALALQASLLVATRRPRSPTRSAPRAWRATAGCAYGTLPAGVDTAAIVARHTPPADRAHRAVAGSSHGMRRCARHGRRSIQLARLFGIRIGASPSWFVVLFLMIYYLSGVFDDVARGLLERHRLRRRRRRRAAVLRLADPARARATPSSRGATGSASRASSCGSSAAWRSSRATRRRRASTSASAPPARLVTSSSSSPAAVDARRARASATSWTPRRCRSSRRRRSRACSRGWPGSTSSCCVFNLVPAFPLDGGRIARAIAWKITGDPNRGTRFSARLGQGFAYILMGLGAYVILRGDAFGGLWFLVLGWFLAQAARGGRRVEPLLRAPRGRHGGRRHGHPAGRPCRAS